MAKIVKVQKNKKINLKKVSVGKSKIHGYGIFAKQSIKRGEKIFCFKGPMHFKINKTKKDALSNPDWVGMSKYTWLHPIKPYVYVNHSCNPNAGIKGRKTLVAMKAISVGEEVVIDYSITEIETRWEFRCGCGEKICRKNIKSIQDLPENIFSVYMPFIPTKFQKAYLKHNGSGKK